MRKRLPLISFFSGFIFLSQEILWIRVFEFLTGGQPTSFGFVLTAVLLGIAWGALALPWLVRRYEFDAWVFLGLLFVVAAQLFYISFPILLWMVTVNPMGAKIFFLGAVFVCSLISGGVFPLLTKLNHDKDRPIEKSLTPILSLNILGSSLGPLVTGYWLFNLMPTQAVIGLLAFALFALGVFFLFQFGKIDVFLPKTFFSLFFVPLILVTGYEPFYSHFYEKLHHQKEFDQKKFKYEIQNSHGIINVTDSRPDIVYGGNAYDGRMTLDPIANKNKIRRAYLIPTLHPNPEAILQIGLGGGAWSAVLQKWKGLKKLTIIEINPGYVELIAHYPEFSPLLSDPRIEIIIDDGRRWLNRNPDKKFDFVLMNASFHWRSHMTHILSHEFFSLVRSHLNPGGVFYLNTTSSNWVKYTGARIFHYMTSYDNFVALSDTPFSLSKEQKRANLLKFSENNKPFFLVSPELQSLMERFVDRQTDKNLAPDFVQKTKYISDDNMATEFKLR